MYTAQPLATGHCHRLPPTPNRGARASVQRQKGIFLLPFLFLGSCVLGFVGSRTSRFYGSGEGELLAASLGLLSRGRGRGRRGHGLRVHVLVHRLRRSRRLACVVRRQR